MRKLVLLLGLGIALLTACQNSGKQIDVSAYAMEDDETTYKDEGSSLVSFNGNTQRSKKESVSQPNQNQQTSAAEEKISKIIKDGNIGINSLNISKDKLHVDELVASYKAYYQQDNYNASDYALSYSLNIRIPSKNFETFIAALENGKHEITSKNISARDVTEEYVDLEIRLKNNRAYLKRYNELLSKADSIKDILAIQEKTRQISSEIESILGRLKYLDDKVGYSTLQINLRQQLTPVTRTTKRNFANQIISAAKSGFEGFLDIMLLLISIWPLLFGIVFIYVFRKRFSIPFGKKSRTKSDQ